MWWGVLSKVPFFRLFLPLVLSPSRLPALPPSRPRGFCRSPDLPLSRSDVHGMIGITRILIVLLALTVLAGCSLVRLGYGHLDTFALWTADEYFDLDADQKQEFQKRFAKLHDWHRYEQLPDYAAFLSSARARLEKGITREDVLWATEEVKQRYRTLVSRAADDAAALLLTVTPEQLGALQRQWDEDNRDFVREYRLDRDVEAQQRARARRVLSRIRDWVGHLDDAQDRRIIALANELPLIHGLRYEDRLRRQREFLQLMQARGMPQEFTERLRHWLANWEEGRDPAYHREFEAWVRQQADFYTAVYGILLPHQRTAVAERVQRYADDFTQLARRPAPQAASR